MYRSINQLSKAKTMKKNAVLAFALFLILLTYLVLSTKPTSTVVSNQENEVVIKLP